MPAKDGEKKQHSSLGDKVKSGKSAKPQFEPDPSILLQSVIPPPMWGVNPRSILGKTWWNKERKAACVKSNLHCHACGVEHYRQKGSKQYLEGHEQYEIDCMKGEMVYLGCVALCHYCHMFIHEGRMRSLLSKGQLKYNKYAAIMKHGDQVLGRIGKTSEDVKLLPPIETWAPTGRWYLIIDGKKYTRDDLEK